jgi:hypothetical protein
MTNNKQQTAVKLYTEKEVLRVLNMVSKLYKPLTVNQTIEHLTPIELPSHHEIWEEAIKEELNQRRYDFMRGADFVRDKIQGQ